MALVTQNSLLRKLQASIITASTTYFNSAREARSALDPLGFKMPAKVKKTIEMMIKQNDGSAVRLSAKKGSDIVGIQMVDNRVASMFGNGHITTDVSPTVGKGTDRLSMGNETITSGAYAIIGGKGQGKSTLAKQLLNEDTMDNALIFDMGEPESMMYGYEADVFSAVFLGIASNADGMIIDSLRTVVNESGGNLKTGGLGRDFAGIVTQVERVASAYDVGIVMTINPSSSNPAALESLIEDLEGSIALTIAIDELSMSEYRNNSNEPVVDLSMRTSAHRRYNPRMDFDHQFDIRMSSDTITDQEIANVSVHIETDNLSSIEKAL